MFRSTKERRATFPEGSPKSRRLLGGIVFAVHWLILVALVAGVLVAAVLLDQHSRLFVLKIVLAATLTVLPAWIYLLFISSKGQRLYDEFVINLHQIGRASCRGRVEISG